MSKQPNISMLTCIKEKAYVLGHQNKGKKVKNEERRKEKWREGIKNGIKSAKNSVNCKKEDSGK